MNLTANTLAHLLDTYGYALLFPLATIEGPIVTILGGILAAAGHADFLIVYGVVVAGDLVGDVLYYEAGKQGRPAIARYFRRPFRFSTQRLAELEHRFVRHRWKTLVLGKWTHTVGAFVLVAAGAARVPFGEFVIINFLATLPKSLVFLVIGYYSGRAYLYLSPNDYVSYISAAGFVIGLVLLRWLLWPVRNAEG